MKSFLNETIATTLDDYFYRTRSFSPNNKVLFVTGYEGIGFLWNFMENQVVPLEADEKYTSGEKVYSRDSKWIAGATRNYRYPEHHLFVWETETGKKCIDYTFVDVPRDYNPQVLTGTPSGDFFVTYFNDGKMRIGIFYVDEQVLSQFHLGDEIAPYMMAFSPKGDILATVDGYQTLVLWRRENLS